MFVLCGDLKKSHRAFIECSYYTNPQGLFTQLFFSIPMGINCAPLVADLFLFCYERVGWLVVLGLTAL